MAYMLKKYREEIRPQLFKDKGYSNVMQVPKLTKIVISCGIGSGSEKEVFNEAKLHISMITGQMPVVCKARKNVANFKLRKGMPVGVMVTLRGPRMYDFFERLVNIALPRVRDFRGVSSKGFDGAGNYNLGMPDISVFTEVDLDKMKHQIGINITFVTTAQTNEEAFSLLQLMEVPFEKK